MLSSLKLPQPALFHMWDNDLIEHVSAFKVLQLTDNETSLGLPNP